MREWRLKQKIKRTGGLPKKKIPTKKIRVKPKDMEPNEYKAHKRYGNLIVYMIIQTTAIYIIA